VKNAVGRRSHHARKKSRLFVVSSDVLDPAVKKQCGWLGAIYGDDAPNRYRVARVPRKYAARGNRLQRRLA